MALSKEELAAMKAAKKPAAEGEAVMNQIEKAATAKPRKPRTKTFTEHRTIMFTPENFDYLTIMGRVTGTGMNAFINLLLDRHREQNMEVYEKSKNLLNNLKFEFKE